jgi:hypothetical protein
MSTSSAGDSDKTSDSRERPALIHTTAQCAEEAMTNPVSLTIEPKVIEGVIQAQITAAVAAQFSKTPEMIEKLVSAVMSNRVDEKGNYQKDSYYNKYNLIEVLSHNAIKESAEKAIREWVAENQAKLKSAIRNHLVRNQKKLVQLFVDAAEKAISPEFDVRCSLQLKDQN